MMKKYLILSTTIHILLISVISIYLNNHKNIDSSTEYDPFPKINISISKIDHFTKPKLQKTQTKEEKQNPVSEPIETQTFSDTHQQENTEHSAKETDTSSGNIIPPRILNLPPFDYPLQAKIKKIEGSVLLKMNISTNGIPSKIYILKSSGSEILDSSAVEYVKKITFEPAKTYDNIPIETEITYLLHFMLK